MCRTVATRNLEVTLENPMDGGAWWAAVHGVAKSRTWLSDFTFHFHALEKETATHSNVLAWRIPGTGEPGGLPSLGSHRVGHDWSDLAAAEATECVLGHQFYFHTCKKELSNINNHFQIRITNGYNGYKWIHYGVKSKLHLKFSYEIWDLKDISGFPQVAFCY